MKETQPADQGLIGVFKGFATLGRTLAAEGQDAAKSASAYEAGFEELGKNLPYAATRGPSLEDQRDE
jgi:hypothetical protein